MDKFGNKLFELRRKAGLSQEKLGEKIGVSRQAISNWETGSVVPDMVNIIKLSEFFGVNVDYLISETNIDSEISVAKDVPKSSNNRKKFKLVIVTLSVIELFLIFLTIIFTIKAFVVKEDIEHVEVIHNSFFNLSDLDLFIIFTVLLCLVSLSIVVLLIKNNLNKRRQKNV